MKDLARVRKYVYRHCRVDAGFNVDFFVGGEILHGVCRNASAAGVRAEFSGSIAVGSTGLLVLHKSTGVIRLEARVAYVDRGQVGLDFTSNGNPECADVVAFASQTTIKRTE